MLCPTTWNFDLGSHDRVHKRKATPKERPCLRRRNKGCSSKFTMTIEVPGIGLRGRCRPLPASFKRLSAFDASGDLDAQLGRFFFASFLSDERNHLFQLPVKASSKEMERNNASPHPLGSASTAGLAPTSLTRPSGPPGDPTASENIAKQIAKDILKRLWPLVRPLHHQNHQSHQNHRSSRRGWVRHRPLWPRAKLVVHLLLLRIAQDFVGFAGLFELIFRRFVAWILVWVELHGQLAIGLFDFLHRGIAMHTQGPSNSPVDSVPSLVFVG